MRSAEGWRWIVLAATTRILMRQDQAPSLVIRHLLSAMAAGFSSSSSST
jgi:hypothetical protein